MTVQYITIEQAIETHQKTIQYSGGGANGLLNKGQLESVLEHIKNDDYYPTFIDKLTHLFFGACNLLIRRFFLWYKFLGLEPKRARTNRKHRCSGVFVVSGDGLSPSKQAYAKCARHTNRTPQVPQIGSSKKVLPI